MDQESKLPSSVEINDTKIEDVQSQFAAWLLRMREGSKSANVTYLGSFSVEFHVDLGSERPGFMVETECSDGEDPEEREIGIRTTFSRVETL
jgi:hypothetical protein